MLTNPGPDVIDELITAKGISYIDKGGRIAREETVLGEFDMTLNGASAVHSFYPSINGEGIVISIKEKPFDINDLDLRGRVIVNDQFDESSTLHATIMATVAAGAGNTSSFGKGVAWGALVTTSDFERLLPDPMNALLALGVSVQNHSYGVGVENYYGIESNEYDQSSTDAPEILHVFSSGNEGQAASTEGFYRDIPGFANITGQFKTSKNTISAGSSDRYGNVVSQSSRGPAYDGRVKPELIAYGDAGSSEASAIVSGVAALLQQAFKNKHLRLPEAALIKAALINSADDSGRPNVDFETGYGSVNALRAVRTITEERFMTDEFIDNGELVFELDVPANQDLMKITLAWNDPPAEPFSSKALVNDLDLSVYAVGTAKTFLPWVLGTGNSPEALQSPARRGVDTLNNIEQVTVENPAGGKYQLKVTGSAVPQGPQRFYVAYEWASGFEILHPLKGNPLRANTTNIIRWSWYAAPAEGTLEFKFAAEDQWRTISQSLRMENRYYEWDAPDTTGLMQLRLSTGNEIVESAVIVLSDPQRLQVGFNCEEEVLFFWRNDPAATGYVLYQLGEKYLEPLATGTDTIAIVNKQNQKSNFYSLASLYSGQTGHRESTIDYTLQGVGCYIKSFLPRGIIVTDKAIFDVELGTTYNLKTVALQANVNGAFETIDMIESDSAMTLVFTDPSIRSDVQIYRLMITTASGSVIYGPEVEVLFLRDDQLYVYPNPAPAGMNANIIVDDEEATLINLYDIHGKLLRQFEDFGIIKTINTAGLTKGTYILRMRLRNGNVVTGKLMLL